MANRTYTVIFNSRGSNVLTPIATALQRTSITYYVNWANILPTGCTRYSCNFVFKSESYAGAVSDNGFVNMNIGKTDIFDGTTQTYNLGIIYPVIIGAFSFYNSTNNDNNPIILYPNNDTVTITLKTFAGVAMGYMTPYVLILTLEPLYD